MKRPVLPLAVLASAATVLFLGYRWYSGGASVPLVPQLPIDRFAIEQHAQAAQPVVRAQNTFGVRLLQRKLGQQARTNVLISPLSIWQCGEMAQLGTGGAAKTGLRRALSIPAQATDTQFNAANVALNDALKAQNGVTLKVANALWAGQEFPLVPTFAESCQKYFGAEVTSVDFAAPDTLRRVNDWVLTQTGGKITDLVQPSDLRENTAICLTNAVYFHGQWQTPFEVSATQDAPFHCADGTQQQVPLMTLSDLEYSYLSGKTFEGVRLPYQNSTCALWALLPRKGKTPKDMLPHLDFSRLRDAANETKINLRLPRFKMAYSALLNEDMKALGATAAFADGADFRPMFGEPGLITTVRHQAILEVDEEGTTATAATEGMAAGNAASAVEIVDITFDRPFVVALVEEKSGALLMLGVVNAPEQLNQT